MTQEIKTMDILKEPMAMGEVFVESGMFPDLKSQAQAVVKIMAGKELGLTAFQSISGMYFVGGKMALQANVISGLIKKSGKYDYEVISLTDELCSIDFFDISSKDAKKKLGNSTFGKTEAVKAGLINRDNYKNHPRNMYFARAVSNGGRWFTPDAIMGYYSVEEMQDTVDESPKLNNVIEITSDGEVRNNGQERISKDKE